MKRTLTALTLVAALSAVSAPSAFAMGEELTMLELAVENAFNQVGIDGVDIQALSLAQLAQIKAVLESERDSGAKRNAIMAVIENG